MSIFKAKQFIFNKTNFLAEENRLLVPSLYGTYDKEISFEILTTI